MQDTKKTTKESVVDNFPMTDSIDGSIQSSHIHFLVGNIEQENIDKAIRWLVYENLNKQQKLLTLYINSDGGALTDAFALIDIMRNSYHPIRTIGIGSVMSAAFLIFACGTKGERFIGQNASSMCHQFSDEVTGKYHDMKATMREHDNVNHRMAVILADATGLDLKSVKSKLLPTSDVFFTADEMIKLGIADHIL
jgi:ATP-dependent Clp protease protease subunit